MIFTEVSWTLIAVAIALLVYCMMKITTTYQYWSSRGIDQVPPLPIVGNILPVMFLQKSIGDIYLDAYARYPNKRLVGVYEMFNPVLVVTDTKLIEKILIKDFQYFADRPHVIESGSLFEYGLFQIKGTHWRSIRYKTSPAFTTGKLKDMFNGMLDCTDELLAKLGHNLNNDFSMTHAISSYALDAIANTAFGIEINDKEVRDTFVTMGSSIFDTPPKRFINLLALQLYPKLASKLGFSFVPKDAEFFFRNLILNTLKQRENDKTIRNDFVQHLLKLKQKFTIDIQSKDEEDEFLGLDSAAPGDNIDLSDDILAGQAFQFISAGFDPIKAAMIHVMYDLGLNGDIQERVREHINEVLAKHGGYSYGCVKDMTYLEQCVQETLRLHPLSSFLFRICTKDYYIVEENLHILKGQKVIIPVSALHMDPQYFPDPDVYNPERFPPNCTKSNFTYLPFGDGPRICIGARYALVVIKLGLAKIITNYKFTLSSKTKVPIEYNKQAFLQLPKEDVYFNMCKI